MARLHILPAEIDILISLTRNPNLISIYIIKSEALSEQLHDRFCPKSTRS